jgi:hypothetical protein
VLVPVVSVAPVEAALVSVAMPVSGQKRSATLQLETTGRARGLHAGSTGSNIQPTSTAEHLLE